MNLRDQPLIITNEVSTSVRSRLSWQNIHSTMPNLTVQLTESLAASKDQKRDISTPIYYCKLHNYLNYCLGEKSLFTVRTGEFDVKETELDKNQKRLYLLSLNCCRDPILSSLISLDIRFGDWFEQFFPRYLKEVVYDKGHTWFFIGPENTESELHSDHNYVHTTLQQCDGTKEVFLVDPTTTDVLIRKYGEAVRFRIQGEKVVLCHEGTALSNQLIDEKVLYGVLNAGDTLYIPSRWGHMVRAITKSITVSRDFIDERNVDNYFTSIYKTVQC